MSKFKVGDKVKITRPRAIDRLYKNVVVTIEEIDFDADESHSSQNSRYFVMENDRPWLDDELDLLEENKLSYEFKLTPELQHDWEKLVKNSYTGKLCGKNLFENYYKAQENVYKSILDNEEHCDFCKYRNDCHGISCYGGQSIEPPCAYQKATEYIDDDKIYERYIKGIWEKEEEKEMNKVLNLWFERKQEKIIEKYAEMEQDFINNHYSVVKSYNELVEQFEKDLDDLYKFDKVNEQFVLEEISDKNTIKYDIDFDKLSCEFTDKHIKEKQGELKELAKIREEVEAQLSLSNELEYQQKVLIQYNIIDKKTKKIVE